MLALLALLTFVLEASSLDVFVLTLSPVFATFVSFAGFAGDVSGEICGFGLILIVENVFWICVEIEEFRLLSGASVAATNGEYVKIIVTIELIAITLLSIFAIL